MPTTSAGVHGRMLYSTGSSHLLSAALARASGRSTLDLARAWPGGPLGVTVPPWSRDPQGVYCGGNEMALSPRTLFRFDEAYRQGGVYDGQRIVPKAWVRASWETRGRSPYSGFAYGYGCGSRRSAGTQSFSRGATAGRWCLWCRVSV